MRGDIEKLPKWAQQEIGRLTRDLADANAKLSAGPDDSDTFADPYSEASRPLGDGTLISFRLGAERDEVVRARIETRHDGSKVLNLNGGEGLIVLPLATNSLNVKTGRV